MVAVSEYGIYPYGVVEVALRPAKVSQVELGDASLKVCPVGVCVQLGQDVELLYGALVFAVLKSESSAKFEHVLIPLGSGYGHNGKNQAYRCQ